MPAARARRAGLWLRWSLRDLRHRWVLVGAIAMIIAIGTGAYAGLGSTATWRRSSNDASYAALATHDIRVILTEGAFVPAGSLADAVGRIDEPARVAVAEERLVVPTQVDASHGDTTVLVPGRLVGVPVATGAGLDRLDIQEGRDLTAADDGEAVAVLETKFAEQHDVPIPGSVVVTGGDGPVTVDLVGTGVNPEYFIVRGSTADTFAAANFAVLFAPLATAQAVTGNDGLVNDLVLRAAPGTDVDALAADLSATLGDVLPNAAATVVTIDDDEGRRILYDDIENDQKFWNVFAFLILAGAAVAAFNLISRIVESQRREIGTGMALGVSPGGLAIRPLLVGVEVAFLGVVLGVAIGYLLSQAMKSLLASFLPLPVWQTAFQPWTFLQAAAIGLLLPVLATVYPVWRAVRVPPVAAIRPGHLAARGPAGALRRVRVPGGSLAQMPARNVLRAPRRTLLTALGIGAAITVMVAVFGMLDSFTGTIDTAEAQLVGDQPDRLVVTLDGYYPVDAPEVQGVLQDPAGAGAQPLLDVGAVLLDPSGDPDRDVATLLEVLPLDGEGWHPEVVDAVDTGDAPGVVLSAKAAADLGVEPGDTIVLRHPKRAGLGITFADTEVVVAGLHRLPLRPYAFVDEADAALFGAEGVANAVQLQPAPGTTSDDALRALFGLPGVASVRSVTTTTTQLRDLVDQFVGILQMIAFLVLVLALLIAFNATSISVDERTREHATMFAFGVRVRTVLGMTMAEGLAIGVLGTLIGLALGAVVLNWFVYTLAADTLPDVGLTAELTPSTIVTALVLGVVAVAVAPLLTVRRLRRLDLPSALRVME